MPIIDTRRMMPCCIKSLRLRPSEPWPTEGELAACGGCTGIMEWQGGAWRLHWRHDVLERPLTLMERENLEAQADRRVILERLEALLMAQRERFPC